MPITVGKCYVPWPHISNNQQCVDTSQVPCELMRLRCDPFLRLSTIPTISYLAKKADCQSPCIPQDHLDLVLSSCYDQHRQWWAPNAQIKMQCPTYRLFPWGRAQERVCTSKCFPNPFISYCPAVSKEQITVNHEPYRNDVSHMNCNITSPHISNTNRGFARPNLDGLFYNS